MSNLDLKHVKGLSAADKKRVEQNYNNMARNLREKLISNGQSMSNSKDVVRRIFQQLDDNNSGTISTQELKHFLHSRELNLLSEDDPNIDVFADLMVEQIDINR